MSSEDLCCRPGAGAFVCSELVTRNRFSNSCRCWSDILRCFGKNPSRVIVPEAHMKFADSNYVARILLVTFFLTTAVLHGQTTADLNATTGVYPFGSYHASDVDVIDLSNGRPIIDI